MSSSSSISLTAPAITSSSESSSSSSSLSSSSTAITSLTVSTLTSLSASSTESTSLLNRVESDELVQLEPISDDEELGLLELLTGNSEYPELETIQTSSSSVSSSVSATTSSSVSKGLTYDEIFNMPVGTVASAKSRAKEVQPTLSAASSSVFSSLSPSATAPAPVKRDINEVMVAQFAKVGVSPLTDGKQTASGGYRMLIEAALERTKLAIDAVGLYTTNDDMIKQLAVKHRIDEQTFKKYLFAVQEYKRTEKDTVLSSSDDDRELKRIAKKYGVAEHLLQRFVR